MMTNVYVRYVKIDETTNRWQYATSNRASSFVDFGGDDDPLEVVVGRDEQFVDIAGSDEHSSGETLACAASDITFAQSKLPIIRDGQKLGLTATCRTVAASSGSGYVKVKKSG
jgi:hypothetical protein